MTTIIIFLGVIYFIINCPIELSSIVKVIIIFFSVIVFCFVFVQTYTYFIVKPGNKECIRQFNVSFNDYQKWEGFKRANLLYYLVERNLLGNDDEKNQKSIDYLISLSKQRYEMEKESSIHKVISSHTAKMIIFFLPVWSAFNNWMFNFGHHFNMVQVVSKLVVTLCSIGVLLWFIHTYYNSIFLDFFQKKVIKIGGLIKMLESIKFGLSNRNYLAHNHPNEIELTTLDELYNNYETTFKKQ